MDFQLFRRKSKNPKFCLKIMQNLARKKLNYPDFFSGILFTSSHRFRKTDTNRQFRKR